MVGQASDQTATAIGPSTIARPNDLPVCVGVVILVRKCSASGRSRAKAMAQGSTFSTTFDGYSSPGRAGPPSTSTASPTTLKKDWRKGNKERGGRTAPKTL